MNRSNLDPAVHIFTGKSKLAQAAAQLFSDLAVEAVARHGRFTVTLSGGSTPQSLFSLLAKPPYAAEIPWPAVHFFWGDERLVPPDDPGSNYYHAAKLLLNLVPTPLANIHRVKGELPAFEAVQDTIEQLQEHAGGERLWPRFDLIMLGMGSDGHTASLFPGSPAVDAPGVMVKAVTADYEDRPAQRLTFTPALINDARHVLFLVTGANKADALSATLNGPRDLEKWPAQRIKPNSGVITWFVDQPAASHIQT